jgi:DUF4097 and DUF4098 domain-containing protein YvlB
MRKVTKVFLIIAGACILVGALLSTVALAAVNFDITALSTDSPRVQKHHKAKLANLTSIRFSSVADDLKVQTADVSTIEVDYWENDTVKYSFAEGNEDGKAFGMWHVDTRWWNNIGFNFHSYEEHPVVITVPKSFAGSILVNSVSGDVLVSNSLAKLDYLSIKTISGTITSFVPGEVKDSYLNSISGDILFEFASVASLSADSISGEITGTVNDLLKNHADYAVSAVSTSGMIDLDEISNESAKKTIELRTISGDITLNPEDNSPKAKK